MQAFSGCHKGQGVSRRGSVPAFSAGGRGAALLADRSAVQKPSLMRYNESNVMLPCVLQLAVIQRVHRVVIINEA